MENHHFQWENPILIAILNINAKLPEGLLICWQYLMPQDPTCLFNKFAVFRHITVINP
jgi:hypothetical protein